MQLSTLLQFPLAALLESIDPVFMELNLMV